MEFLQRFNPREQGALLALAIVVGAWLLYTLLWTPLSSRRDTLEQQNTAVAEQLQRVDTMVAQYLMQSVSAAKMLGAKVILTGLSPETAMTLIKLGIDISGLQTHRSLHRGIAAAFNTLGMAITRVAS